MIASTLTDIAWVIGISGAVGATAGLIILFALGKIGKVRVSGFGVHADVDAFQRLEQKIDDVNTAVNHRKEGDPTLVERVGLIEDETRRHRVWEHEAFQALASQLGVALPPHPLPLADFRKENP